MGTNRIGFVAVLLLLVLNPAGSVSALNPYDDFSGARINSSRWNFPEFVREVQNGKLVSRITAYGKSDSNILAAVNPNSISYLEADVSLTEAVATYDPGDPNITTYAHASLAGVFYNNGTGTAGSAVGDVMAQVRLSYSRGHLKAEYYVIKYINEDGTKWDTIHYDQISGSIVLNQIYNLSIRFEPGVKSFTFGVGTNSVVWTDSDSHNPNLPGLGWKALRTGVQAPAGHWGHVSATFDNVIARDVDSLPIFPPDTFSSSVIDNTKWMPNLEAVREIKNGTLRLKYRRMNITSSQGMPVPFQNPELINEMQARVSLTEFINTETSIQARIGGYFFNTAGEPYNNYEHEVFAVIYLGGNEASPKAGWYVLEMNADGSTKQTLDSGTLFAPIALGDTYTLYLHWDGNQFTFKCTDILGTETSATSVPGTGIYASNIKYKEINTRIVPATSPNNSTISAIFDDVMTNVYFIHLPLILH